jgi:hypothetical protein
MFAMLAHGLARPYVDLGFECGLPVLLTRQPGWVENVTAAALDEWEERGMPVFDHLREMPLEQAAGSELDSAKRIFDELQPGLTYLLMHPALDTPELRAICSDWRHRVADYEVFGNHELCDHVRRAGIHLVGWRPIQRLMEMIDASSNDRSGILNGGRTYYDWNTPRFVRSHQSAVAKAIHREVWGPGVQTEKEVRVRQRSGLARYLG